MVFMDDNFLLTNEAARVLYHQYAAAMPIIDYHCHIPAEEIAKDVRFSSITDLWLGADHYKWRAMRSNGVPEELITGNGDPFEKFEAFAATLERAIGNPLYHWSHLELQRYFGIKEPLTKASARRIYDRCNEVLADPSMTARGIIRRSDVRLLCTTDDPADDLRWHRLIAMDPTFSVKVLPAFRPDRALDIEKPDFITYIRAELSNVFGRPIELYTDLKECLAARIAFFAEHGCKVADHGMSYVCYAPCTDAEAETIFRKAINNEPINLMERLMYRTHLLSFLAAEYAKAGWVMQLHYGVKRDNNTKLFRQSGANNGCDCIDNYTPAAELADFLNSLCLRDALPKTILYSLNPIDNAVVGTVLGCFQDDSCICKIQQGSAWWFNDNKKGMEEQLTSLANLGVLGNFVGMLTDSRSFLSYTRHEYFRRILCNLIGTWVTNGEYPCDLAVLGGLVADISFNNCNRYFDFGLTV
ncbi:MAG: glucuronate isomerase [Lachnospiraceae bacterium]|nr:glucuronate isomerase [Lachnospiraceae bacterium]